MKTKPWGWVPTLYFAEGVPFNLTATLIVILKNLNYANETITLWSSAVTWPWMVKALWAPLLDIFGTKRGWIITFQAILAGALTLAALAMKIPDPLIWLIPIFMLVALCSATHDVAADGFYIMSLTPDQQAFYCGWQSTFYKVATIGVTGGLVFLVGILYKNVFVGNYGHSWMVALLLSAAVMGLLALWHAFTLPPEPKQHAKKSDAQALTQVLSGLGEAFTAFFCKKGIFRLVLFLLLFRFAESTLGKMTPIFLLAERAKGGLELGNEAYGIIYGTVGMICLLAGGIVGGIAVNRAGLGRCLMPMALALNIPDLVYVGFALGMPQSLSLIGLGVGIEQFGFGFGLAGYMMVLVSFVESSGRFKTSHYAFMTGFTFIGVSIPGFYAGKLQEAIGYANYFWVVIACIVPALLAVPLVRPLFRPDFGKIAR